MDEDTFYIDFSTGSGENSAEEDHSDSTAVIENDGRSKTRTGLDVRDSRDSREVVRDNESFAYFEWLNQLNDGRKAPDLENRERRADAKRDAKTFASQLGMTSFQKKRVTHLIDRLETLHFGNVPVEGTVLALISLVANEDGWMIRKRSDGPEDNKGPNTMVCHDGEEVEVSLFTKLMGDCRVSPQSIRRARENLRSEL